MGGLWIVCFRCLFVVFWMVYLIVLLWLWMYCALNVLGYLCLFVYWLFRLVMLAVCFRMSCLILVWVFWLFRCFMVFVRGLFLDVGWLLVIAGVRCLFLVGVCGVVLVSCWFCLFLVCCCLLTCFGCLKWLFIFDYVIYFGFALFGYVGYLLFWLFMGVFVVGIWIVC